MPSDAGQGSVARARPRQARGGLLALARCGRSEPAARVAERGPRLVDGAHPGGVAPGHVRVMAARQRHVRLPHASRRPRPAGHAEDVVERHEAMLRPLGERSPWCSTTMVGRGGRRGQRGRIDARGQVERHGLGRWTAASRACRRRPGGGVTRDRDRAAPDRRARRLAQRSSYRTRPAASVRRRWHWARRRAVVVVDEVGGWSVDVPRQVLDVVDVVGLDVGAGRGAPTSPRPIELDGRSHHRRRAHHPVGPTDRARHRAPRGSRPGLSSGGSGATSARTTSPDCCSTTRSTRVLRLVGEEAHLAASACASDGARKARTR